MYIYDTKSFPYVEFGDDIKRQIRLVFSPDIGNAKGVNIVTCSVPVGGISEGHVHPDADEIIHFNIAGQAKIDGVTYDVPANGFVYAPKGCNHECINTSETDTLELMCIFVPAFKPYGRYPELIDKTKQYLKTR